MSDMPDIDQTAASAVAASLPPPWIAAQRTQLLAQRGHAWLLGGPSGLGQYRLALELVRAWLCDAPTPKGACGQCGSCHAIDVRTHADICVLMPETIMLELGWPLSEKSQDDIDSKKRKSSKEIRVDAMRDAVEFTQRTSGRGRGKAVLVFPAERMNHITANALLKTLEEPPGDVKFVLASESADRLLPTIRSRCLVHNMTWPETNDALAWLKTTLNATPAGAALKNEPIRLLLRACGGRPEDVLDFLNSGRDPLVWASLAQAVRQGDVSIFKDWSPPQVIDALHKLCHDLLAIQAGASPRFLEAASLAAGGQAASIKAPAMGTWSSLTRWAKALAAATRTMEHPFNAGLMTEALVSQGKSALNSRA